MRQRQRSRNSTLAHVLLIAVTLVWGTTFPLVKAALRESSPLVFNLLRMSLASVLLFALNSRSLSGLSRKQLGLCAVAGFFLAVGYELQTAGLNLTTPSKSAFLTGLVVVIVPFLSTSPALRGPETPRPPLVAFAGALLAFCGVVLLTSEPGAGFDLLSGMHRGEWLSLGCALAFAVHLLTLARSVKSIPPRALGTLQIAWASVFMLLCLPMERHSRLHLTPIVVAALAVTAILATAAAFTIQSWAQQYLPASHTALIFTLEPVFAWLTSLLFLGEHMGARSLIGAAFILLGIVLAEVGPTALSQAGILPLDP